MKKHSIKFTSFTLIELIAAMGVFSIIMVVLLSFVSSAQKVISVSASRNEIFENANIAMDLISRDLQCALYDVEDSSRGIYPFWHEADDKLNFIATTKLHDTAHDISDICEIKYARSNGTLKVDDLTGTVLNTGWLVRSVTGDFLVDATYPINNHANRIKANNKYNFLLYPRGLITGDANYDQITDDDWSQRIYRIWKEVEGGTASNKKSSDDFRYVIPQVVDLKFTCYNKNGADMRDPDGNGNPSDAVYNYSSANTASMTPFPYCVKIDLTLLDKTNWEKWIALGGNTASPASDTGTVLLFRQNNQRSFSKMVYIGERKNN